MAAFVLSPERWRELSSSSTTTAATSSSPVPVTDGCQPTDGQTPTSTGQQPAVGVMRRRISRVFYESHTPVSSPVVLNLHPADASRLHPDMAVEEEDLAAAGVILAERFLPQRRSPGQRSQDSGFSGYSGDSASEGSSSSGSGSSNNSPVPAPSAASNGNSSSNHSKRSPLVDVEAAEKALAAQPPAGNKVLETDLDATPIRSSGLSRHVSRIYIGTEANSNPAAEAAAQQQLAANNLNLRDVLCEKNIQPVNLSGGSNSPDKCVGDKSLIGAVLASSTSCTAGRNHNNNLSCETAVADRSADSQTALLLEHKSLIPAAMTSTASTTALRPNLSWKKLSESFRRVISSGRMMAAGSISSPGQGCLPAATEAEEDDDRQVVLAEESFTDEEKSRMLLLAKRSNIRRMQQHLQLQDPRHLQPTTSTTTNAAVQDEEGSCINRVMMTESPQPTSRYVGGPRSSTPRKSMAVPQATAGHRVINNNTNNNNNNNININNQNHVNHMNNNNINGTAPALPRRCSRLAETDTNVPGRPRVHWADDAVQVDPVHGGADRNSGGPDSEEDGTTGRRKPTQRTAGGQAQLLQQSSCWPENSTWDSDTPSLEIGQQQQLNHWPINNDYPILTHPAALMAPEPKRIRRGLRMGTQSPHVRKSFQPPPAPALLVPPPPPVIIPAASCGSEFRISSNVVVSSQQLPFGLRWSPVEAWLKDLPMFYQPESTCALQNKAILVHHPGANAGRPTDQSDVTDESISTSCLTTNVTVAAAAAAAAATPAAGPTAGDNTCQHHRSDRVDEDGDRTAVYTATLTARTQVRRLQRRAHLISTEFAQLCSFIELYEESKLASLIPLFLAHVIQFIREAEQAALQTEPAGSDDLIHSLRQTCAQLVQLVTFSTQLHHHPINALADKTATSTIESIMANEPCCPLQPPAPVNWSLARQITARLGQIFVSIVDTFVGREIQVLTAALESGKCVMAARLAANSLMSLGADAARPALAPLISAFQRVQLRPVWADLLRALSALCSSADIIQDFEQLGGLAVVFDVLCNPRSRADLEEKSEAAGLLAQITSPWLDPPAVEVDQQALMNGDDQSQQQHIIHSWPSLHLTPYISPFIAALTELSAETETEETLLLSTAALANLTFSHSEAVQLMTKYRTAQVLVQASSHRSKDMSVFIQDQIATILANMAAVYSARADLVAHGALTTLLDFLQHSRPCPSQRPAEVTASERVLKKSAIALSRVCGEEDAARQIIELHGIERLAQLVRDPRERNHSDGVLVACLAALHKIATACGNLELDRRGASDLIENRLLDVFLQYSSRPESYV